jgi:5-bromo-4-chloroindolyl phosphate hydrolysis protein
MINWKQKLSSRKFWALISALVISVLVFFNVGDNEIAQVTSIIAAFGSVAAYIFAEAAVDKARVNEKTEEEIEYIEDNDEEWS